MPVQAHRVSEEERLAALHRYEILDTESEAAFDRVTRLIALICEVPIAVISLVEKDRQWFKSKIGLDATETPRDVSFCAHTIGHSDLFIVPDATRDPLFENNPLVTQDPHVRFYAGAPLEVAPGVCIGSLCVLDRKARELTPAQLDALRLLRDQVVSELEKRHLSMQQQTYAERLQASEQQFRELVEEMEDVFWVGSADGRRVDYVSPAYERIWGHSAAALYADAQGWLAAIHAEDRERIRRSIATQSFAREFAHEYRVVQPNGETRWVHDRRRPIADATGAVTRIIGIISDITAQKESAANLHRAEVAEHVAKSRRDFLANTSHDMRTPLNIIAGYAGMVADEDITPESQTHLGCIEREVLHLNALINNLIDFTRIDEGVVTLTMTPFSLREWVGQIVGLIRQSTAGKKVVLRWDVAADVPDAVTGPVDCLRQVLSNLLGNAMKFTEQGEVVLRVAHAPDPTGGTLVLHWSVSDTGIGMSEEDMAKLFTPFPNINRRNYPGVGLGLSICKRLLDAMGGTISVDSQEGTSSTFHFTTPLSLT